jgi:putative two-component system response regulator
MQDKGRIAVVDDDIVTLQATQVALGDDYNVVLLTNAFDLLRLLAQKTTSVDLILLDVLMPVMTGFEVLKTIKNDNSLKSIPVIMLTGQLDREDEFLALELGAVDYMRKPTTPLLLKKRVENHLLFERQKRELQEMNRYLHLMASLKTDTINSLHAGMLKMMGNLAIHRENFDGKHAERTTQILSSLIDGIPTGSEYASIVNKWDISALLVSSPLYDIGKIHIPDAVRLKPGPLDADECEEMKKHAVAGVNIIEQLQNQVENKLLEHAKIMSATHHERWDGKGYPRGLKQDKIPVEGRLIALVDAYNALTSGRPFRKAFSEEQSLDIISRERGRQFDPGLTDIFVSVMRTSAGAA